MDSLISVLASVVIGIFVIGFVSLFIAFPIMWCWNAVMPAVWGLTQITWGQAWCLMFLSGMLIKSSNVNSSS